MAESKVSKAGEKKKEAEGLIISIFSEHRRHYGVPEGGLKGKAALSICRGYAYDN
jgi:hypothetical protein